jgi:hypothetical protein
VTAASRPQKTRLNDATATQLTGFSKKSARFAEKRVFSVAVVNRFHLLGTRRRKIAGEVLTAQGKLEKLCMCSSCVLTMYAVNTDVDIRGRDAALCDEVHHQFFRPSPSLLALIAIHFAQRKNGAIRMPGSVLCEMHVQLFIVPLRFVVGNGTSPRRLRRRLATRAPSHGDTACPVMEKLVGLVVHINFLGSSC